MLSTTGGRMAHLRHTPSTMARTPTTPLTDRCNHLYSMILAMCLPMLQVLAHLAILDPTDA